MDKTKLTTKERAIIAQAREILRQKGQLGGRRPKPVTCPVCGEECAGSVEFRKHIKGEHDLYYLRAYNPDGTLKTKKELERLIAERAELKAKDRRYANPGGRGNGAAKAKKGKKGKDLTGQVNH